MGIWRSSGDQSGGVSGGRFWGHSGSILRHSWTLSGPYLRKPHETVSFTLHLAVGRALSLEYTNIGVLGGSGGVPGIALPGTHPATAPRVHPSPHLARRHRHGGLSTAVSNGRGAHIRRTTLFICRILRYPGYDRGI